MTLRNGAVLRIVSSTLTLVQGTLRADSSCKVDISSDSQIVNIGTIAGGGNVTVPAGASYLVKAGGLVKLDEPSRLIGSGQIINEGLFSVQRQGSSDVELVNYGMMEFASQTGDFKVSKSLEIPSSAPADASFKFRNGAILTLGGNQTLGLQTGRLIGEGVVDGAVHLNNSKLGGNMTEVIKTNITATSYSQSNSSTLQAVIGVGATSTQCASD